MRLRADPPPDLPGVVRAERRDGACTLWVRDPDETVRALVTCRVPLDGLEVSPASLEEAFVALTEEPA